MILQDFENRYKEVTTLIRKNKLNRALELTADLSELLNAKNEQNELTMLMFRLSNIESNYYTSAIIDETEFGREQRRIIEGLNDSLLPNLEKIKIFHPSLIQ